MQTFPIQKRFVNGPDFIALTQEQLKEQLAFAKSNGVKGFIIGDNWKNNPYPDLKFLQAKSVKGLVIYFEAIIDLTEINNFHELEVFKAGWMSYPQSEINFKNFPQIRVLDINWNKNLKYLDQLTNTIRLNLWGYKPKSKNLETFQNCSKLVYANFIQPGIDNLDGIQNLEHLKELELGNARSLKQFFSEEKKVSFALEKLTFELCPNFDIETIPQINTLKHLVFNKIGKMDTLKHVLNKLSNLESIVFTQSELLDGDLEYFLKHPTLKKIIIDHKKHYSMKEKAMQHALDEKNKAF
jgi:hypothetical protein